MNAPNEPIGSKPSLQSSRRSFLKSGRLVFAGVAAASVIVPSLISTSPALAGTSCGQGSDSNTNSGNGGQNCGDGGVACFLEGTQVATPDGGKAIQDLRIGDLVLTWSGRPAPVEWLAKRTLTRAAGQLTAETLPIQIKRGAIADQVPDRDLYVSPGHALYLNGILIPAQALANGASIVASACADRDTITYYHIELDRHDVIFAEGLATETYMGTARSAFDNASEYAALYGSLDRPLTPYAPLVQFGGRTDELASNLRSAVAPIRDIRRPLDRVRDHILDRATQLAA